MCFNLISRTFFQKSSLLAFALAIAPGLAFAQGAIKIGCLLPMSGGSAAVGAQFRVGIETALDQINRAGGVKSIGGAKLEVIFADSQSKADVGVSEAERLIKRENVAIMCGSYNSAVTFPATEVAERNKTPWLAVGAVKDEITERGFKYIFRINNKASYDSRETMDVFDMLRAETGKGPKRIALLYEGGDWGRSYTANIKKLAAERKYDIVFDEAVPPHQTDFMSQILKLRTAKPDALIVAFFTPDQLILSKQIAEVRLDLPFGIHSGGGAFEDPSFYAAISPAAVAYTFVQEDWQLDILETNKNPLFLEANKRANEKLGYGMNASVAQGMSTVYVIYDALERARSADKEKLRSALAETDITAGPALVTGYRRIKFDKDGQNTFSSGVISENINGKRRTIWPKESRAADVKPIWPIPAWNQR